MAVEIVSSEAIDRFERITKYDVRSLMSGFVSFIGNGATRIYNYYKGQSNTYPTVSFANLDYLKVEFKKVVTLCRNNSSAFTTYDYWILLELVEEALTRLETISNFDKWTRSPIVNDQLGEGYEIDYVLGQGQTIEEVAFNTGSSTPQEDWVGVTIRNGFTEEDYSVEGGAILKIKFSTRGTTTLNSVVDNLDTQEKTFGLDIDRTLTFEDNDLKTLTYYKTLLQTTTILAQLRKGDNPFFREQGFNDKAVIGSNTAIAQYPTIFRELSQVFATDDSYSGISLIDVQREGDAIRFDFEIQTKTGETITQGVLI